MEVYFVIIIGLLPLLFRDVLFHHVMVLAGIYSIASLGLSLFIGYAGQISIGHSAFFGMGSYATAILTVKYGVPPLLALVAAGTVPGLAAFIIGILFLILFGLFFKYSSQGIYMRSVADNQPAALSLGVHVRRVFALSWAIAFIVAAMSGIVLGIINGINVHKLSDIGLKVFPVVILGGLDSIGGAIIGGLIIGLLETFTGGYISTSLREIIPYIVLVVILMVKPYGLFGLVEIERV